MAGWVLALTPTPTPPWIDAAEGGEEARRGDQSEDEQGEDGEESDNIIHFVDIGAASSKDQAITEG